jgi:hypothetical protein
MPVNILLRDVVVVVVVVARDLANGDGVGRTTNPCPIGAKRRSAAAVFMMMATRDGDDAMMPSIDFVAGECDQLGKSDFNYSHAVCYLSTNFCPSSVKKN